MKPHAKRRWRSAATVAVCVSLSLGLHALGAVALSILLLRSGAVTAPTASVDPGAHRIRVSIIPSAPEPTPEPEPAPEPEPTVIINAPATAPTRQAPPLPPVEPARAPRPTLTEIILTFASQMPDRITPATEDASIAPPRAPIEKPAVSLEASAPPVVQLPPVEIEPQPASAQAEQESDDAGVSTSVEIIGDIAPKYPPISRRRGEQGLVVLDVHVLPTGKVVDVRVRRHPGHSRLVSAAIDAVRAAKFTPATRDGEPVAAWLNMPVRFVIE